LRILLKGEMLNVTDGALSRSEATKELS